MSSKQTLTVVWEWHQPIADCQGNHEVSMEELIA